MNLKWTALAAMALLTPAAFAQQGFGWVVTREYQEQWQQWLITDTWLNNAAEPLMFFQRVSPTPPHSGTNGVTGSQYTLCPWTAQFPFPYAQSYSHSWQIPEQVELYNANTGESGPAPVPLHIQPYSKVIAQSRFYKKWGYETWFYKEGRGTQVEGNPVPPTDPGPHTREVLIKDPFQMRIQIVPLQ